VLDRTTVQFTDSFGIRLDANGNPLPAEPDATLQVLQDAVTLPGYLTGTKTDALVYGPNNRELFVAGAGKIYMIDMVTRKLTYTLTVGDAGTNITSLVVAGDWLYVAEGSGYGLAGTPRLLRVNVNGKDPRFMQQVQQLHLPANLPPGPNGFLDMAVSAGRYLAVTAPVDKFTRFGFGSREKGGVYIIDLEAMEDAYEDQLAATEGADTALRVAEEDVKVLDFGNVAARTGQLPYYIDNGPQDGQFVMSTTQAYNKGFAAVTVSRDEESGAWNDPVIGAPFLKPSQPQWWNNRFTDPSTGKPAAFMQNVQRSAGVAVSKDGKYAFVADYNHIFDEIGFMDGLLINKQVGGKIGIIKDPFGPNPQYVGSTTPIEGASLESLSISADGSRLWATAMTEEYGGPGDGYYSRFFSALYEFNVQGLITASTQTGGELRKPVDLGQPGLLPKRYTSLPAAINNGYEPLLKSWAVDSIANNGDLLLISPLVNADARPVFQLKATRDISSLRIYVSAFGPGDGLFPSDKPMLPDWHGNVIEGQPREKGPAHDERILTTLDLLPGADGWKAGEVYTFDKFANDAIYANFKLTAGQKYWWAAEAVLANGTKVTASQMFTVKRAVDEASFTSSSVTIITHGYQPPIVSGADGASAVPFVANKKTDPAASASAELARQIARDQGGFAYRYEKATGRWTQLDPGEGYATMELSAALAARKPVALVPDWVLESGMSDSGFAEAAADAVYASLIAADTQSGGKLLSGNIHLIAHSRGTVVNSELAQRILWGVEKYGLPKPADLQMTTLDPHDFKQPSLMLDPGVSKLLVQADLGQIAGALITLLSDTLITQVVEGLGIGALLDTLGIPGASASEVEALLAKLVQSGLVLKKAAYVVKAVKASDIDPVKLGLNNIDFAEFYDPNVQAWRGVNFSDNYFQHVADENARPGNTVTPNGRSLFSNGFDLQVDLTGMKGFTVDDKVTILGKTLASMAESHSRPHAWYAGTVTSGLNYFAPGTLLGKDKAGDRHWVVQRRADGEYERNVAAPAIMTPSYYRQPGATTFEAPWYLQRIDKLVGTTVYGRTDRSGLQGRLDETAGNAEDVPKDTWEAVGDGFYFSKLGGGATDRPSSFIAKTAIDTDNTEFGASGVAVPTVFNGDFQASVHPYFGRFITSYQLPGWSLHNGLDATSPDASQSLQLAFKGVDAGLVAAQGWSASKLADFEATLASFKTKYGAGFTLGQFANTISSANLYEEIRGEAINQITKGLVGKFAHLYDTLEKSKFLQSQVTLVISTKLKSLFDQLGLNDAFGDPQKIGDFGLDLQKVAKWGFQLDAGYASLTHNWMALPRNAQQVTLEVNPASLDSAGAPVLKVEFLTRDAAGAVTVTPAERVIALRDLVQGTANQVSVRIPDSVRGNSAQSVQVRIRLVNYDRFNPSVVTALTAADQVVIDNIRVGAGLSLTETSGLADDQTVFMHDRMISASSAADEGLAWQRPQDFYRANQHTLTLRNDTAESLSYSATALANEYLYVGAGSGTAATVDSGERQLFSGRSLAAGATATLDVTARLTDEARRKWGDSFDAVLLSGKVRFDATRSTTSGPQDAGAVTLRTYYFGELTNLDQVDGVLTGMSLRAGETRTLKIYNPEGVTIEADGRWVAQTEGVTTTLTLVSTAQDRGRIESTLNFKLNNQTYFSAKVRADVRATQQVNVDLAQLNTLLLQAAALAHTPTADVASLSGNDLAVYNLLVGLADKLPTDLDAADLEALGSGVKVAIGLNGGVYLRDRYYNAIDFSFENAADLDATTAARTTNVVLDGTIGGNAGEAGRSGWDFASNQMANLLTSGSGAVTNQQSIRSKEYVLSRLINQQQNGTAYGVAPFVSVPAALREALEVAGGIEGRSQRMHALGRYFGWLFAHELGHSMGLPDEYKLDGVGNPQILVPTPTFMAEANSVKRSDEVNQLMHLALSQGDRDVPLTRLQVDNLILYMQALARQSTYLGAPPATESTAAGVVDGTPMLTPFTAVPTVALAAAAPSFASGLPVYASLRSGDLQDAAGWSTRGNVVIQDGKAVLGESASRQAQLSQAFTLGANDKLLSFTIESPRLFANAAGPFDAFEVALLDATTGLPIAGSIGLNGSDALLNLQTNGRERLATTVRKQVNADGSATYFVALAPELAGKSVLLSFDLLGFAAQTSTMTVRDVKLIGDPQAVGDAVALDEDATATVDVLANDLVFGATSVTIEQVDGPAHGTLTLLANGQFSYQPAANYNGSDSFSYRFVIDGKASNTATVALTVRPVNDAPTLTGRSLTAQAGQTVAINPLSTAFDIDGDALTAAVVDGPAHGVLSVLADGSFSYKAAGGFAGPDSFSYRVSDGQADSNLVTVAITISNDGTPNLAPTAADGQTTGAEDQALALTWAHFAVVDPDSRPDLLQVEIAALPVDGTLERQQADGSWAAVAVGERFSQAGLAARGLRFVPADNASGGAGYFGTGEGNGQAHYAHIGFKAFDGELYSPAARLVVDITAQADAPTLSVTGGNTATGLEDAALTLHAIVAGLVDNDGSETLVLTLTGMPDGFTLSDGARSFTPSATQRVVNLAGWQLDALVLTPPRDFNGSVVLQLQATAIEGATGEYATTTQLLTAQFVAVADAPTLVLSPRDVAVSRELVATSWETPANTGTAVTVVSGPMLEGWTVLSTTSGKTAAFEIEAAGDKVTNLSGNLVTVQPMAGNGNQWLTLRNGRAALAYQTLGIERTVDTIDGALYTFSFDYAGGPGFAAANTAVGLYVDGVKVAGHAGTSPTTGLSWASVSFSFSGNGQPRRIALVLEGGSAIANGTASPQRSAHIDDIRLVETLPVGVARVYGLVDTAIALPAVAATLGDRFGSETLALSLIGLPVGAVLSDGVRSAAGGAAIDLAGWDLAHVSVTPPAGFTGEISLTVRATSSETANGASATASQGFVLRVLPGTPVATPAGLNPFVVMTAALQSAESQRGNQSVNPASVSMAALLADERGQLGGAAEPAPLPKTAAEIAQAEADRARAFGDAWLKELEERAKAQWQQLVGGK